MPAETVVIREARPDDLAELLALYGELADRPGSQPGDVESSRAAMAAVLADSRRHLLVAEREGELLGTVDLLVAANLTHAAKPWAMVENVVVASRARRQGITRALMERAFEVAGAAGCYKVQLLSGRSRVEAHELYRALGMEPVAEGFKAYLGGASSL